MEIQISPIICDNDNCQRTIKESATVSPRLKDMYFCSEDCLLEYLEFDEISV